MHLLNSRLSFRKKIITLTAIVLATVLPATGLASNNVAEYQFDILREGKLVGSHDVRTVQRDGLTQMTANTQIKIGFLGIPLYKFSYQTEEIWDGQGLKLLTASVDDDGDKRVLKGQRNGDSFEWSSNDDQYTHPLPIVPTNHWNSAILEQNYVINTLTGKLNRVDVVEQGKELVRLPSESLSATRYSYRGQLELDSWYDEHKRWIAMRFKARDGSYIDYLCRNCSAGTVM